MVYVAGNASGNVFKLPAPVCAALDTDGDGRCDDVDFDDDGDTLPDLWETGFGLDPLDPADAALDGDGDGLINTDEFAAGTDPGDDDSDDDGLYDGVEGPLGTDPANPDTDGDGFNDGLEVSAGSDPTDPASTPSFPVPALPPAGLALLAALLTAAARRELGRSRLVRSERQ
jgi:hypothetical protein